MKIRRIPDFNKNIPKTPGTYFWDEWNDVVEVTQKGKTLWVTPPRPHCVPVKISPRIAGKFIPHLRSSDEH